MAPVLPMKPVPARARLPASAQTARTVVAKEAGWKATKPFLAPIQQRTMVVLQAATRNSNTKTDAKDSVEMFVAHTPKNKDGLLGRARELAMRIVPKPLSPNTKETAVARVAPRNGESNGSTAVTERPSNSVVSSSSSDSALANSALASKQSRALQAELGMTTGELRTKVKELQEVQSVLRKREGEIHGLKSMLAQKEIQIKSSRSELVSARIQVQDKDLQLQMALEQLTTAAKERAVLRRELITTQTELGDTLSELESWTLRLTDLKGVMDAADTDEEEPARLPAPKAKAQPAGGPDKEYFSMLKDLQSLALNLSKEAQEDQAIYDKLHEADSL